MYSYIIFTTLTQLDNYPLVSHVAELDNGHSQSVQSELSLEVLMMIYPEINTDLLCSHDVFNESLAGGVVVSKSDDIHIHDFAIKLNCPVISSANNTVTLWCREQHEINATQAYLHRKKIAHEIK